MQAENKVVVIGGGAAGLMAAATAAMGGAQTVLLEKNERLGKKLYITGKGRCNVTNLADKAELMANIPHNPKFCYGIFNAFTPQDLMQYIQSNGTPLKTERGNRVFPQSDKANDIINALERGARSAGVTVKLNTKVLDICTENGAVTGVETTAGRLACNRVIVATGGLAYPSTGSTGDGYRFAAKAGHNIMPQLPALVPLNVDDEAVTALQGLSLKNVTLNAVKGKKVLYSQQGEMLFTHFGISGPLVLTLSSAVESFDDVDVYVDLKPALSMETLDARLIRDFLTQQKKLLKNALDALAPQRLQALILARSGVNPEKNVSALTRQERNALCTAFKHLTLPVSGRRGYSEAVITRGGVDVRQVDSRTMESRLVKGLYFAGEVLDVDAYTGGFNLQFAFSCGYAAGRAACAGENDDIIR